MTTPLPTNETVSRGELWAAVDRATAGLSAAVNNLTAQLAAHESWHRDQMVMMARVRSTTAPAWWTVVITALSSLAAVIVAVVALAHVA